MSISPLDVRRLAETTFVARAEHHRTLGSTNDRARQCAAEGPGPLPLLIVADAQTAGRGRGANRWWTGPGSLALSLLLDPRASGIDRSGCPLAALAAAVAVTETVAPLLPGRRVGIHWPNDVFAAEGKLSGILVEMLAGGLCVVGIGLNVNNTLEGAPPELRDRAATLLELTGTRHDPAAVLNTLLGSLARWIDRLAADPADVARQADALCLQHGRTLAIESGGVRTEGRCDRIAPDGALVLDTPEGRQTFYSGTLGRAVDPPG